METNMSDADRQYWDNDPDDPMPEEVKVDIPTLIEIAVRDEMNTARAEREARIMLEHELERHAAWWRLRIQRERAQPSPHPDTETIAYNIEH